MTRPAKLAIAILVAAALSSCGREGTPTGPSGPTSFLTGTWRGTVTIQVNPGDPNPPAPMSGDMTWTFEVVPQTNMQSLRADDPLDASVADDGDDRIDGAVSRQQSADARSARTASSTHRAAVAGRSGASGPPRRRGSRRTSPARTVSSRRSPAGSC